MALVMAFICYLLKQDAFETSEDDSAVPGVYVYA